MKNCLSGRGALSTYKGSDRGKSSSLVGAGKRPGEQEWNWKTN